MQVLISEPRLVSLWKQRCDTHTSPMIFPTAGSLLCLSSSVRCHVQRSMTAKYLDIYWSLIRFLIPQGPSKLPRSPHWSHPTRRCLPFLVGLTVCMVPIRPTLPILSPQAIPLILLIQSIQLIRSTRFPRPTWCRPRSPTLPHHPAISKSCRPRSSACSTAVPVLPLPTPAWLPSLKHTAALPLTKPPVFPLRWGPQPFLKYSSPPLRALAWWALDRHCVLPPRSMALQAACPPRSECRGHPRLALGSTLTTQVCRKPWTLWFKVDLPSTT